MVDGRRRVAPRGQRREQLLSFLEQNPNSKPAGIAKGIETSSGNVHNVLRAARKAGLVRKVRGGGYTLSKAAKDASPSS